MISARFPAKPFIVSTTAPGAPVTELIDSFDIIGLRLFDGIGKSRNGRTSAIGLSGAHAGQIIRPAPALALTPPKPKPFKIA